MEPLLVLEAYTKRHLPKITYILKGTNPSPTFLEKEKKFVTSTLLPLLGYNRHTPTAFRHCPYDRLGLDMPHFYCEAGLIQLRKWLKHIRNNTEVGDQLIINLNWAQLRSGLEESIFVNTHTKLPHLPNGRTNWMRSFLQRVNGQLYCEQDTLPPRNCANDHAIMDVILQLSLTDKEITSINNTREYFQVFWASDVVDPHAKLILPYFTFQSSESQSSSTLKWPKQDHPSTTAKKLWTRNLKLITKMLLNTKDGKPFALLHPSTRGRKWKHAITTTPKKDELILLEHGIPITTLRKRRRDVEPVNQPPDIEYNSHHVPIMTKHGQK